MTRALRPLPPLLVAAAVFTALFAALTLVNRSPAPAPQAGGTGVADTRSVASTAARIRALERTIEGGAAGAQAYAALGEALLQRQRETGDPSFYPRASGAFAAALKRDPVNLDATVGRGNLALGRHDFRRALGLGRRARRLAPASFAPFAVLVDAQIELGRYAAAERTLQRMIDLKPGLASYSRVSYFRELTGDLRGARQAMRLAVAAGGGPRENMAYVRALLGDLELAGGRIGAAASTYRGALMVGGANVAAEAGLARVDVARGRPAAAARRLRSVSERLPLPSYLTALAELELVLGREQRAAGDLDVVRAQRRLLAAAGARPDTELVLFEADHGGPARAVRFARRLYAEAPSVRSADALGWALTRAGDPRGGLVRAQEALRLGSRDPLFHYHAGIAAQRLGRSDLARRELRASLTLDPSFSPLRARRARAVLRSLR